MRYVCLLGLAIVVIALADQGGMAAGRQASDRMSAGGRPLENQPPVVAIVQPDPSRHFGWGAQFRYAVTVSDREDGESAFGEIKAHEVLLEVDYLPAMEGGATPAPSRQEEGAGLAIMRKSTCFTCHADKTALVGPSFAAIASKYAHDAEAVRRLGSHVTAGSSGTWGTLPRPPHSHFPERGQRGGSIRARTGTTVSPMDLFGAGGGCPDCRQAGRCSQGSLQADRQLRGQRRG